MALQFAPHDGDGGAQIPKNVVGVRALEMRGGGLETATFPDGAYDISTTCADLDRSMGGQIGWVPGKLDRTRSNSRLLGSGVRQSRRNAPHVVPGRENNSPG